MRFVAPFLLLTGAAFAATTGDPSPDQIDDIIAKFAAKEAAFAQGAQQLHLSPDRARHDAG